MRPSFLRAFAVLIILAATPSFAGNPKPYSGAQVVDTNQAFGAYVAKLLSAIQANGMGVVAQACGSCGAQRIGETIPGNQVIMIFHPKFAVRMLRADVPAGIEAPLRLYVTENNDGTARLTYRLPSHVFAPYEVAKLDEMAKELDVILAKIVAGAH